MLGPYEAREKGTIYYKGNNVFPPIKNVQTCQLSKKEIENRIYSINKDLMWTHLAKINHQINMSTHAYFSDIGALFTLLPLTTRMISSPGAVYGRNKISYTSDTCPIKINWFNLPHKAFLAESSQVYLEFALLQRGVDHVYSIYNSFRKERADSTHLSEFHHIEYEGHITQKQNLAVIHGLLKRIILDLLENNKKDLNFFLNKECLLELKELASQPINVITFKDALKLLFKDTQNTKYKKFTLASFGMWEEVRLTQLLNGVVGVSEMPALEVAFYHAVKMNKKPKVADNTDIIWPGYREIAGSGHRVNNIRELRLKSRIFSLPQKDYAQYLESRKFPTYKPSSGFGLGWERLIQGLLHMPFIYSASQFPRVDTTLRP
ncbi:MAG: amino acid--tRNA ligase-related protein [Candidatus Woesearchaeota archaeon]